MRDIEDHIVNPVTDVIKVTVMDEPGPGGAHHHYLIHGMTAHTPTHIRFQKGPIKESGVNGLTMEALLAVVIDRLKCFQAGPFPCKENANALENARQSLEWLRLRTASRMQRGVEGTSAP